MMDGRVKTCTRPSMAASWPDGLGPTTWRRPAATASPHRRGCRQLVPVRSAAARPDTPFDALVEEIDIGGHRWSERRPRTSATCSWWSTRPTTRPSSTRWSRVQRSRCASSWHGRRSSTRPSTTGRSRHSGRVTTSDAGEFSRDVDPAPCRRVCSSERPSGGTAIRGEPSPAAAGTPCPELRPGDAAVCKQGAVVYQTSSTSTPQLASASSSTSPRPSSSSTRTRVALPPHRRRRTPTCEPRGRRAVAFGGIVGLNA